MSGSPSSAPLRRWDSITRHSRAKIQGGRELDALAMLVSIERTSLSHNASGVEVWRMISVCICTYNRSASLQRTLESFALQCPADFGQVELLVVDNNCTDDTDLIVEEFRVRLPVRRVTERRQGLAHARNRAVTDLVETSFCLLMTMYGLGLVGLPRIVKQSVVSLTPIISADVFCRTGD